MFNILRGFLLSTFIITIIYYYFFLNYCIFLIYSLKNVFHVCEIQISWNSSGN